MENKDIIFSLLNSCVSKKNKGFLANLTERKFTDFCVKNSSGYKLDKDGRSLFR